MLTEKFALQSDPSIRKRGRGFDPRADGPSNDGVKHAGDFEKLNLTSETQMDQDENAAQDEQDEGIERPAQCEYNTLGCIGYLCRMKY